MLMARFAMRRELSGLLDEEEYLGMYGQSRLGDASILWK